MCVRARIYGSMLCCVYCVCVLSEGAARARACVCTHARTCACVRACGYVVWACLQARHAKIFGVPPHTYHTSRMGVQSPSALQAA